MVVLFSGAPVTQETHLVDAPLSLQQVETSLSMPWMPRLVATAPAGAALTGSDPGKNTRSFKACAAPKSSTRPHLFLAAIPLCPCPDQQRRAGGGGLVAAETGWSARRGAALVGERWGTGGGRAAGAGGARGVAKGGGTGAPEVPVWTCKGGNWRNRRNNGEYSAAGSILRPTSQSHYNQTRTMFRHVLHPHRKNSADLAPRGVRHGRFHVSITMTSWAGSNASAASKMNSTFIATIAHDTRKAVAQAESEVESRRNDVS